MAPSRFDGHRALVEAVRDLNLAAGTTAVSEDQIAAATAAIKELTAVLGARHTERVVRAGVWQPRDRAAAGLDHVLNVLNPTLLGVTVSFDHDDGEAGVAKVLAGGDPVGYIATAELTVNALHEGPADSVHGGVIAFLLDCLLGVLVQASGTPAVTGTLDVRYLQRTPLDEPIQMSARITRRSGRKVVVEGWIEHDGVRTVESTCLFVVIAQAGT